MSVRKLIHPYKTVDLNSSVMKLSLVQYQYFPGAVVILALIDCVVTFLFKISVIPASVKEVSKLLLC